MTLSYREEPVPLDGELSSGLLKLLLRANSQLPFQILNCVQGRLRLTCRRLRVRGLRRKEPTKRLAMSSCSICKLSISRNMEVLLALGKHGSPLIPISCLLSGIFCCTHESKALSPTGILTYLLAPKSSHHFLNCCLKGLINEPYSLPKPLPFRFLQVSEMPLTLVKRPHVK